MAKYSSRKLMYSRVEPKAGTLLSFASDFHFEIGSVRVLFLFFCEFLKFLLNVETFKVLFRILYIFILFFTGLVAVPSVFVILFYDFFLFFRFILK